MIDCSHITLVSFCLVGGFLIFLEGRLVTLAIARSKSAIRSRSGASSAADRVPRERSDDDV
jgi:hypothetical protein